MCMPQTVMMRWLLPLPVSKRILKFVEGTCLKIIVTHHGYYVFAVDWSGHFYCGKLTLNVCITFLQCFTTAAAAAVQAADGMAVVVDQAVSEN